MTANATREELKRTFHATGMQIIPGCIPQYIEPARMGPAMIRQIAHTDETSLEDHVSDEDFDNLKAFVGRLFGVDLSMTTLARVSAEVLAQWSSTEAEAMAVSCGMEEHLILLPEPGFQSLDLVAHELGHAAEFTMRRKLGTNWSIVNRPIVSETTAHYAQFHHLLAYGSANRRQGAIGAFLFPYLAAQYVFAKNAGIGSTSDMLLDERFSAFREAKCYTSEQLNSHLMRLENQDLPQIYLSPVEKRFSIPLALKLLDRPEAMRNLAIANIQTTLDDVLREIDLDPNELLDFTNLDPLFASFISGR